MNTTHSEFWISGPHVGPGIATRAECEAWERLSRAATQGEAEEIIFYQLVPMLDARLGTHDYVIDRKQT